MKIIAIILAFIGLFFAGIGNLFVETSKAIFFKLNQGKTQ